MKTPQQQFIDDVIEKFDESITDKVFLMIQNDRDLFHRWLDLLENNKRNVLNGTIAKAIKKKYGVNNKTTRNDNPETFLIKSFQEFEH